MAAGIADLFHAAKIAVHGIDAFESNDFRTIRIVVFKQRPQMVHIIVTEHPVVCARPADPFDHGRMIELIGIDDQVFHDLAER